MKLSLVIIFAMSLNGAHAQQELPKGFKKGWLILADSSRIDGYIKDYFTNRASVVFANETNQKKKEYNGQELLALEIDETKFICFHGDFFKVIADGDLELVQKTTDASGIPCYNGAEAIFINGTEGKRNDYFIYEPKSKELKLVTKKNFKEVSTSVFNGYSPAIAMTANAHAEIQQLIKAVELYNAHLSKQ
jgi:hypothetical protein